MCVYLLGRIWAAVWERDLLPHARIVTIVCVCMYVGRPSPVFVSHLT